MELFLWDSAMAHNSLLTGYYGNRGGINFTNVSHGKWQPWNPVLELRLDRILNPIPMYAKKIRDAIMPRDGQPLGYDLMVGDWVAPDGKGQVADLFFDIARKTNGEVQIPHYPRAYELLDNTLTISFPNVSDGIQSVAGTSSDLRLPREAPTNGYSPKLIKHNFETVTNVVVVVSEPRIVRRSDFDRNANYFFRVRTKTDEQREYHQCLVWKNI